ncbi:hypothetical protein KR215_005447, partial [Drosophila sulfurigaster]
TTIAAAATATNATESAAVDVDGCANEIGAANDICVVEMLQPKDTAGNSNCSSNISKHHNRSSNSNSNINRAARRRCSVGGKCIWPASDWLRRLRNKEQLQQQQQQPHSEQLQRERDLESRETSRTRRSSVLLMVLLSGSEMEAKAVVVSEQQAIMTTPQQPQRLSRTATEEMDDAIDALWL